MDGVAPTEQEIDGIRTRTALVSPSRKLFPGFGGGFAGCTGYSASTIGAAMMGGCVLRSPAPKLGL